MNILDFNNFINEIKNYTNLNFEESVQSILRDVDRVLNSDPEYAIIHDYDTTNFLVLSILQLEKENKLSKDILLKSIDWLKKAYRYITPDTWFIPNEMNFTSWFLRKLTNETKETIKKIASKSIICSPAESVLLSTSEINNNSNIFIKNTWSNIFDGIKELNINDINNPIYINFKLHRIFFNYVHSPVDGQLVEDKVFKPYSTSFFGKNYGRLLKFKVNNDNLYLLLVGENNVQDFELLINKGDSVYKTQELGHFNYGSQVILILSKDFPGQSNIQIDKQIFIGHPIILK